MNNNVEKYRFRPQSLGVSRQVGYNLAVIAGDAEIAQFTAAAIADTAVAKVQAAVATTQQAMAGAAYISQIEAALTEATPSAMGRVRQIAEIGSASLGQIVVDTAFKLGRI